MSWNLGISVLLIGSLVGRAEAAIETFSLDYEFSHGTPPAGSAPWIVATFDDGGTQGSVNLTMTATNLISNEFISEWSFNFDPALDVTKLAFSFNDDSLSTGSAADSVSTGVDAYKADGDGKFDIQFVFPTSASERFTAGELVTYKITSTESIVASSFDFGSAPGGGNGTFTSAAHVQGIGASGANSGWIGPGGDSPDSEPIPEATSGLIWLGLSLMGFVFSRRRLEKPLAAIC